MATGKHPINLTFTKKSFARRFRMGLRGGQEFQLPRLMPWINQGGRFILTEAFTINRLAKSIYRGGYKKIY
jgi:hypothetical protein